MKIIKLHGKLKEFGDEIRMEVNSVAEAVRALSFQLPGFRESLKQGAYHVLRDTKSIPEEALLLGLGKSCTIHIIPVVMGAKGGAGKMIGVAILGVALVAAAAVFAPAAGGFGAAAFTAMGTSVTFGQIALVGGALILSGVAGLLSPTPSVGSSDYVDRETAAERNSFLFDGATNTTEQGQAIPVIYGRIKTGSVVINSSISTTQI